MTPKISTPLLIQDSIAYNEKKLKQEKAELLYAGNFLKDAADLSIAEKRQRFRRLHELNSRTKYKALHLTIGFHPSEDLDPKKFKRIATDLMQELGFEKQPYLVYKHNDAGYPHLHIVASNIQPDGRAINMHFLLKTAQDACRRLEKKYGLLDPHQTEALYTPGKNSGPPARIKFGKKDTTTSICEVVSYVKENYKLCSFLELKAVLRMYNLSIHDGTPGSRLRTSKGIVYQILDENGKKQSGRIPSSSLPGKPGYKTWQETFDQNTQTRPDWQRSIKTQIEIACRQKPADWQSFANSLRKKGITVHPFADRTGNIYDLVYIAPREHIAVQANALDEPYHPVKIFERLGFKIPTTRSPDTGINDIDRALKLLQNQPQNQEQKQQQIIPLKHRIKHMLARTGQ